MYIVIENTPGYLPDSDPAAFPTVALAWEHAKWLKDDLLDLRWQDVDPDATETKHEFQWHKTTNGYEFPNYARLGRVISIERIDIVDHLCQYMGDE